MLAYYIHNISPFLVQFSENFGIRWYGLAYVLAFVCGYWLYRRLAIQGYSELKPEQVGDFITQCAIFGVLLGGRLGYMLFYDLDAFLQNPLIFFRVWDGGMSSHGGILGLAIFTLIYARRHHVSWLGLGDNLVVVAPIGIFFGRVANFINGELYGRPASVPWAVQFPTELYEASPEMVIAARNGAAAINPAWTSIEAIIENAGSPQLNAHLAQILTPRHPSQIYAAFLEGIVLFTILWLLRTKCRLPNGILTGAFFIGYALLRITGEFFRQPDAPLTAGMTRGQFLSMFLILIGIGFLAAGLKNRSATQSTV